MFGNADSIVQVLPNYFLDYRKESNDSVHVAYQFHSLALQREGTEVAYMFGFIQCMQEGSVRKDETKQVTEYIYNRNSF